MSASAQCLAPAPSATRATVAALVAVIGQRRCHAHLVCGTCKVESPTRYARPQLRSHPAHPDSSTTASRPVHQPATALDADQLRYAALDAEVLLALHERLVSLGSPDALNEGAMT